MYKFKNVEELFKIMEDITNKEVQYYRTDLNYDKERILKDTARGKNYIYLWMTRKHGTWLMRLDQLQYKCTDDYYILDYYVKGYGEYENVYMIDLNKNTMKPLCGIEVIKIWKDAKDTIDKNIAEEYIKEFIEEFKSQLNNEELEYNIKRLKKLYNIA